MADGEPAWPDMNMQPDRVSARMRVELDSVEELRAHREAGGDLRGAILTRLDLTAPEDDALLRTALDDAVLLGCELTERRRQQAEAAGALVFPRLPDLPYRAYRSGLYTCDELFEGFDPERPESYAETPDARIYAHSKEQGRRPDVLHALASRLHDHAISEALTNALDECANAGYSAPVAVMGGHALDRDSPGYRTAAELGTALGRSPARFTVLTGGGPGAMESVPLGVRLTQSGQPDLDSVLAELASAPRFAGANGGLDPAAIGRWLAAGMRLNLGSNSPVRAIGIPTWFYGHEPPNPVAGAHAKYFANSVREDGLLTVATGGIVYTPGSAGTIQEVFQDYTQNHYSSVGPAAPMVFLGKDFWTNDVPAAPLVQQLARGREAEKWITITDDVGEAVALLERYAAAS